MNNESDLQKKAAFAKAMAAKVELRGIETIMQTRYHIELYDQVL